MLARPRLRRSWRSRGPGDPTRDPAVLAIPLRHTGLTHCPPMAGPGAAPAASAFGASGSAASVSRPFSGPTPSLRSPLRTFDSALCSQAQRVA